MLYDVTPDSFDTAKTLLERALALDPESVEANMVLPLINHHVALMGYGADATLAMEAAYALGRRVIQLDDRDEYAHRAFGINCGGLHEHDESIVALQRAVDLNANCSLAYGSPGTVYGLVGRTNEATTNQ